MSIKINLPLLLRIEMSNKDFFVYEIKNKQINNYILHIQEEVGLVGNCLSKKEINKLRDMESEKYRIKLA